MDSDTTAEEELKRILGEERYTQLRQRPYMLGIPSREWPGCTWLIGDRPETGIELYFHDPSVKPDDRDPLLRGYGRSEWVCFGTAFGFRRIPEADKILALILWLITDEAAIRCRDQRYRVPKVPKGKWRMQRWDAIVEPWDRP